MVDLTDSYIDVIKKRFRKYYEVYDEGNLTFILEGAKASKYFYDFVGIKLSRIKNLSD